MTENKKETWETWPRLERIMAHFVDEIAKAQENPPEALKSDAEKYERHLTSGMGRLLWTIAGDDPVRICRITWYALQMTVPTEDGADLADYDAVRPMLVEIAGKFVDRR